MLHQQRPGRMHMAASLGPHQQSARRRTPGVRRSKATRRYRTVDTSMQDNNEQVKDWSQHKPGPQPASIKERIEEIKAAIIAEIYKV